MPFFSHRSSQRQKANALGRPTVPFRTNDDIGVPAARGLRCGSQTSGSTINAWVRVHPSPSFSRSVIASSRSLTSNPIDPRVPRPTHPFARATTSQAPNPISSDQFNSRALPSPPSEKRLVTADHFIDHHAKPRKFGNDTKRSQGCLVMKDRRAIPGPPVSEQRIRKTRPSVCCGRTDPPALLDRKVENQSRPA